MAKIKLEILMDVDDDFAEEAKRWEHHADYLLDLDSYPEIHSIYNCQVTTISSHKEQETSILNKNQNEQNYDER